MEKSKEVKIEDDNDGTTKEKVSQDASSSDKCGEPVNINVASDSKVGSGMKGCRNEAGKSSKENIPQQSSMAQEVIEEMTEFSGLDMNPVKKQTLLVDLDNMMSNVEFGEERRAGNSKVVQGKVDREVYTDFVNALEGLNNMQLAHEIALDSNFQLKNTEPDMNRVEGRVELLLKKLYWEMFEEKLEKENPDYEEALKVLVEIKQMLFSLLLPHNKCVRNMINEKIDEERIALQIKNNALDFQEYVNTIIEILSLLCCPARDEDVARLKTFTKPAEIFKEVFNVIHAMQIDLANFLVSQYRPLLLREIVGYEKTKFANFLEIESRLDQDALEATRAWLLPHQHKMPKYDEALKDAYTELLHWSGKQVPETITLDWKRFLCLSYEVTRQSFIGAILVSVFAAVESLFNDGKGSIKSYNDSNYQVPPSQKVQEQLRREVGSLLTTEDIARGTVEDALKRVADQAVSLAETQAKITGLKQLEEHQKEQLRVHILDINRSDNKVRLLFLKRILAHARDIACSNSQRLPPPPKYLGFLYSELEPVMTQFSRTVALNRSVYDCIYVEILKGNLSPDVNERPNQSSLSHIAKAITLLKGHQATEGESGSSKNEAKNNASESTASTEVRPNSSAEKPFHSSQEMKTFLNVMLTSMLQGMRFQPNLSKESIDENKKAEYEETQDKEKKPQSGKETRDNQKENQ